MRLVNGVKEKFCHIKILRIPMMPQPSLSDSIRKNVTHAFLVGGMTYTLPHAAQ